MDAMANVVDADAVEALTLRFRFIEYNFLPLVWSCLREAGWTYHNGSTYHDPGSRTIGNSNDVVAYLDRFAIPDVRSNLESFQRSVFTEQDQEEEQRGIQLRRDVLRIWYRRTASKSVEKIATGESTTTTSTTTTSHKGTSRRSSRASVTSIEKGSDLYLHKNTLKARGKEKKAQRPLDIPIEAPSTLPSIQECIKGIEEYPLDQVFAIEKAYKSSFEDWRFLLSTNHSLLFFGAGSKRNLLNQFCEQELDKEGYALAIDGFDSHVTVEGILDLLVTLFLDGKEPIPMASLEAGDHQRVGISNPWKAHELVERAIVVSRALAHAATNSLVPIFLVIHNLDGESFRNTLAQESLAALLVNSTVANGVASVRLVASVDHVDASALLWNVSSSANFAWIWKEVHTHRPYVEELAMLSEDVRKKTAKLKNQELDHADRALEVLKNLAPRHAEVVQILARLQLGQSQIDGWIDYSAFRGECKTKCAISKDSQLRSFLVELNDHRLIISKKDNGTELVRVPYSEAKLHEILAYNRNKAGN
jgi:origin recognition complex subunit 2